VFSWAGRDYPAYVLDCPTTVECYKTYDDVNLVKAGDVGQVTGTWGSQLASEGCAQSPPGWEGAELASLSPV
jgi:TATA-binding protein-associated factor Taf7